jgi:N-formylglutamate deformylase
MRDRESFWPGRPQFAASAHVGRDSTTIVVNPYKVKPRELVRDVHRFRGMFHLEYPHPPDERPGSAWGEPPVWDVVHGTSPLVGTAIHEGHALRPEIAERISLDAPQRLREEDPCTEFWTAPAGTRIVGRRSRFEVDLNRPRESAVYVRPEDAWELDVWRAPLPAGAVERSLAEYDAFYAMLGKVLHRLVAMHGRVVVLDVHTYNHRRDGPGALPADPEANPDVNLGTGTMRRDRWAPVVEAFLGSLRGVPVGDRRLDVRENVRFRGGNMARWIHETFPANVCVLSIEIKKFFMDEWTGIVDMACVEELLRAIEQTVPPLLAALEQA